MAAIRLGWYEVTRKLLPPVCMQCGAEAAVQRRKTFAWHPPWVGALLLLSLVVPCLVVWPYVLVALITTKRMAVTAPLCEQHKNHWAWRSWFIWAGAILFLILGVAAIVWIVNQDNWRLGPKNMAAWFGAATGAAAFIWLIAAAIIQARGIRASEITDTSITLIHVSRDFVEAVRAERLRYPAKEDDED